MESDFVYNKRYFFQKIKIVMCFVSTKNFLLMSWVSSNWSAFTSFLKNVQFSGAYCKLLLTFYNVNCYRSLLGHLSGLLFTNDYLLDLLQRWQRIRSGPDRIQILLFFRGSGSSFIRRCESGSEFGFALPNNLETKSALHSAKTFLSFGLHLNFGRKNAPIFSEDFFIVLVFTWSLAEKTPLCLVKTFFLRFGIHLNLGIKNAPVFIRTFFFGLHLNLGRKKRPILSGYLFCFSLVYFWFSLIWTKCSCTLY